MNVATLISMTRWLLVAVMTIMAMPSAGHGGEISAFTEPYRNIDVAASEMGTLARIHVKEGDRVTVGQRLADLDDDVLQASLRMADAGLKSQGNLNSALAELRLQVARLDKLIALRARKHASQQEVERTRSQKEIAEAKLETVRDDLKVRSIEYQRIDAQLQRRHLTSPIEGIVTLVYKDVGEFVSPSDPMVVKVVQLDPLLVFFSAPMQMQDQLQVDDTVSLLVGEEHESVTGIVEFVSPTIDAQSNTVRIKIRVPNSDGTIRSGATCRLSLSSTSPAPATNLSARIGRSENQDTFRFEPSSMLQK